MNKEEQIKALLQEWQAENKDKRCVSLIMNEVTDETEKNYATSCYVGLAGKRGYFKDFFRKALSDNKNPLCGILKAAVNSYTKYLLS